MEHDAGKMMPKITDQLLCPTCGKWISESEGHRLEHCVAYLKGKIERFSTIRDCDIHPTAVVVPPVNLYGCTIGENCLVGPFTEIQEGVTVGAGTRVQSHTFICSLVTIEEECFIGHGVMFTNDRKPPSRRDAWERTLVKKWASIGSGAVLLPVAVGVGARVGAGAVVTRDVGDYAVVAGVPARVMGAV